MKPTVISSRLAFLSAFCFLVLFYEEYPGLNYLIFAAIITSIQYFFNRNAFQKPLLIGVTVGLILSAAAVVYQASPLAVFLTWSFLILQASFILNPMLQSLHWGVLQAVVNGIYALPGLFRLQFISNRKRSLKLKRLGLLIFPFLMLILFWNLYSDTNPYLIEFNEVINKLRKELFSHLWNVISFAGFLFLVLGLFVSITLFHLFKQPEQEMGDQFLTRKNIHSIPFLLKFDFSFLTGSSLKRELISGIVLMSILNILLFIVNLTDITWIWFGFEVPANFSLKQFVHEGTWNLLISIFFSMVLILYYFRGNQNYYFRSKGMRILALVWIIQNAILLFSLFLRDLHYIQFHGLAWNRLNLLVFMLLTLSGLILLWFKIRKLWTTWFVIKLNSYFAAGIFVLYAWIPWDSLMINYNLNHPNSGEIDVLFYLSAGDLTLPLVEANLDQINKQIEAHTNNEVKWIYFESMSEFKDHFHRQKMRFVQQYPLQGLLSWNYREHQAWEEMKR